MEVMSASSIRLLATLGLFAVTTRGAAHHAFAAVFDRDRPITLIGTVTNVEWMNPHTWFYIDVHKEDGQMENWALEMGSPNTLARLGWSRNTLRIGQVVAVVGARASDGSMRAAVRTVTLANGEKLVSAQEESR